MFATPSLDDFLDLFAQEEIQRLIITPAESDYQEDGSYYKAHKNLRQENQTPQEALEHYKANLIAKATALGMQEATANLAAIEYPEELLAKMPAKVAAIGETELEMELQVEQEEEQEEELEEQLEIEQVHHEAQDLTNFPLRIWSRLKHSVKEKIHPAYHPAIHFSDNFLPSREKGASLHKRKAFDESMLRIGPVEIRTYINKPLVHDENYNYRREPHLENLEVVVHDSLEKSDKFRNPFSANFWHDIRLDKPIENLEKAKRILEFPEIHLIFAQLKFLDGRIEGYTEKEQEQLKVWLKENEPQKMQEHFLNQVLALRHSERAHFAGSQLDQLFKACSE